jgi:hypothetical protein
VTYQALKEKHGKKIADRMRDEKRKQQETMDKEGSTDRPVVKPSEDLPDCQEPWGLFLIYIYKYKIMIIYTIFIYHVIICTYMLILEGHSLLAIGPKADDQQTFLMGSMFLHP